MPHLIITEIRRVGQSHTPTQSRMLAVLSDGLPHSRAELHACLSDDLAPESAVHAHLTCIRAKLRPGGLDILCVLDRRRAFFRLVRLVVPADVAPGGGCRGCDLCGRGRCGANNSR